MAQPMKSAANPIDIYSGGADPMRPNPPSSSLWIGNVSQDVSEAELKALFEKHGTVLSTITYPSRNYGFVNFKDVEGAKSAKQGLQGQILHGIPLKIEFAKPARPCKSLWVSGISPSTSKEELEKEFLRFGKIQEFRFLRDRNTAYIDYVRLEDAAQALKSMNGKQIGGVPLRVDFLRSQSSKREHGLDGREGQFFNRNMGLSDFHWIGHANLNTYPELGFSGSKRKNMSVGSDTMPSKILFISYPPSVIIDEDMLHNAMILFGEIERIRNFSDRNYAFVEFRSADEAKCAKEGLQGKLFNDPRISIEYSSIEFPEYRDQFSHPMQPVLGLNHSGLLGRSPGFPASLGGYGPELYPRPPLGAHGLLEPGLQGLDFFDLANIHNLRNPMGGPAWKKSPPTSGSGAWDVFDGNHVQREQKRSRLEIGSPENLGGFDDEEYGLRSLGTGRGGLGHITRGTTSRHGPRHVDSDCIWRGLIAKVGTPVCRARCVPIGDGLDIDIPDVVNCTARTGLDILSERYDDAIGFSVVFFVPDSEDDFASYTEFLRYLGSKDRAGVAKFEDGTTLFLVPPSDFLTNVLKVSGPERLYGVVLKFPPVALDNNTSDMNPQSKHLQYIDPPKIDSLPLGNSVDSFPKAIVPVTSSLPVPCTSQPGLALTPELIATLTSLLPASSSGSHTASLQPASTGLNTNVDRWNHESQSSDQYVQKSTQMIPQMQHLLPSPIVSNTPGHLHSMHDFRTSTPQGASSSGSLPAESDRYYRQVSVQNALVSDGVDNGDETRSFYNSYPMGSSNPVHASVVTAHQPYTPLPSGFSHQGQPMPDGVAQENVETESDKNERYKSTLLFAANLLSRIHQPSANQPEQGAGSR